MATPSLKDIDRYLDRDYVIQNLVTLARTPTDVPLGENEIEPTDPKLRHYVHGVVAPKITELGFGPVHIDELNNLTCRIGSGVSSPSLLIMGYMSAQHGNYTDPELEGRLMNARSYGDDEDCVFGKGTAQNKGALAAVLGALNILARMEVSLPGTVTFVLNAESQSSHRCSVQLFDRGGLRADAGWLAVGTSGIVIGHRGRVDVYVTIRGEAGHSSQPGRARNAIWGLRDALERLADLRSRISKADPDLGAEHLEPYKLVTSPIAPHTMPGEAHLTIDRRVLPDTDPDGAVAEIRETLGAVSGYEVEVRRGVHHLPYRVPRDHPIVRLLAEAHAGVRGNAPWIGYVPYAYDAGYANSRGVPTVMFGPPSGTRREAGSAVLAAEYAPVSEVLDFTKVYAQAILAYMNGTR
jgi:acetylornithine deacetylase/succinyl-diaminopimelate desuccinylase-like protein